MIKNKDAITNFLRAILGIIFLMSAISKLVAPGLFEITIMEQGIFTSREIVAYLSRFLIVMELFLGLALFQSFYLKNIILPLSIFVLLAFTILLSFSVFAGDTNNCGCFGEVVKMSPLQAIIKNIFLIFIGMILFRLQDNNSTKIYIPILILVVSFGTVFGIAPIKSYDNLVFTQYTNFENEGRVDLTNGNNLVAVFFIECEHCIETAQEIVKLENETGNISNLYILFAGEDSDSIHSFIDKTQIVHPYFRIPLEDFFGLIGNSPPRIYWLKDGKVKEYWDDNFVVNIKRFQNKISK
ncbi:MAG: hypothetical protein COW71_06065 [Ignavibacteriales bacterium CG18_big_fil_WC_8_21_14_2_50_31_20]|nr:MAG: hypothetical protein COW71_06065 [Ignavibacteriales bacterium CG18_big_fil_WC_8_21_14_2_50_31_20]